MLTEQIAGMLNGLVGQAEIGQMYVEKNKIEKELIQLNKDIMSGKKELVVEEVDSLFREYNKLGRLIAESEKNSSESKA